MTRLFCIQCSKTNIVSVNNRRLVDYMSSKTVISFYEAENSMSFMCTFELILIPLR
jgi:hypothetical protein